MDRWENPVDVWGQSLHVISIVSFCRHHMLPVNVFRMVLRLPTLVENMVSMYTPSIFGRWSSGSDQSNIILGLVCVCRT